MKNSPDKLLTVYDRFFTRVYVCLSFKKVKRCFIEYALKVWIYIEIARHSLSGSSPC